MLNEKGKKLLKKRFLYNYVNEKVSSRKKLYPLNQYCASAVKFLFKISWENNQYNQLFLEQKGGGGSACSILVLSHSIAEFRFSLSPPPLTLFFCGSRMFSGEFIMLLSIQL